MSFPLFGGGCALCGATSGGWHYYGCPAANPLPPSAFPQKCYTCDAFRDETLRLLREILDEIRASNRGIDTTCHQTLTPGLCLGCKPGPCKLKPAAAPLSESPLSNTETQEKSL